MDLKEEYKNRIKSYLSEEDFRLFLDTLDMPAKSGFILNKRKLAGSTVDIKALERDFSLNKVYESKWYTYYTYDREKLLKMAIYPGKSIYHHAGLFYIQEPSSNMVLRDIDIKDDFKIIDLCSAPGGKSIQAFLSIDESKGKLVCNEIDKKRLSSLKTNLERMGFIDKVEIRSEDISRFKSETEMYDLVILDAPCSGEGMMRKSDIAREQWNTNLIEKLSRLQKELIKSAAILVKKGGFLSYSTCTYAREEDEDNVDFILKNYNDFELINMRKIYHFEGIGEGQFYATFRKK